MAELNWKLCYVSHPWAYFTSQALADQWGDDWNDAPYDCNAGEPYEWRAGSDQPEYQVMRVAFDGPLETPGDREINCRLSVRAINEGRAPWLSLSTFSDVIEGHKPVLMAGASLDEFFEFVEVHYGEVYVKRGSQ